MERIELVELVREKADVGYTDAKEALDACGDDLLDALVWLEAQGRSQTRTAHVTTAVPAGGISGEMYAAQAGYARSSQSGLRVLTRWLGSVRDAIARAIRRGMDTKASPAPSVAPATPAEPVAEKPAVEESVEEATSPTSDDSTDDTGDATRADSDGAADSVEGDPDHD